MSAWLFAGSLVLLAIAGVLQERTIARLKKDAGKVRKRGPGGRFVG